MRCTHLYFVELEKFENKYKTLQTTLDRWIKFLNNADLYSKDTLPNELAEVEPIKKASERLEVMHFNDKEREVYEAQQKRYLDELSRIQEAVGEAVKGNKIEIAKNAIGEGANNKFISSITDLSIEQIEQLRSKK